MEQLNLIEQQPQINKTAVMSRLLEGRAQQIDALVDMTGWGLQITQHVLLQLVVDGRVRCLKQSGQLMYALRANSGESRNNRTAKKAA
ncbi:MAG: hypothetical protein LBV61_07660 [Burkholderiaceae bacterium]|jgi:hypothetical protein|nr:hypothetical protein [Burkholderiaceae bacterium]